MKNEKTVKQADVTEKKSVGNEKTYETANMACCVTRTKVRSEEERRAFDIRINRIIGQLNGIKKMLAEDRYCDDILIQLSATDKSVKALAHLMLESHMHSCFIENIQAGNTDVVDEVVTLFKKFL